MLNFLAAGMLFLYYGPTTPLPYIFAAISFGALGSAFLYFRHRRRKLESAIA